MLSRGRKELIKTVKMIRIPSMFEILRKGLKILKALKEDKLTPY